MEKESGVGRIPGKNYNSGIQGWWDGLMGTSSYRQAGKLSSILQNLCCRREPAIENCPLTHTCSVAWTQLSPCLSPTSE